MNTGSMPPAGTNGPDRRSGRGSGHGRRRGRGLAGAFAGGAVGLLVGLVVVLLSAYRYLPAFLEQAAYDTIASLSVANTDAALDRVVLIGVDDESIDEIGRWPWPRRFHAGMINGLTRAGAAVIGFDLLFLDPDVNDDLLAEAIDRSGRVILAAQVDLPDTRRLGTELQGLRLRRPEGPLAAAPIGIINAIRDRDGTVRKLPQRIHLDGEALPGFAAAAAQSAALTAGRPAPAPPTTDGIYYVRFFAKRLPALSYVKVLKGEYPDATFRDKVVLIGPTSPGLQDIVRTPVAAGPYGVEAHGFAVASLLAGRVPAEVPVLPNLVVAALFGMLAGVAAGLWRSGWGSAAVLVLCLVWFFWTWYAYNERDEYWQLNPPFLTAILAYGGNLFRQYLVELRQKQRIQSIFGRYVDHKVVSSLLEEGEGALNLGGQRREITVLFMDVRGFTRMSEGLEPEAVVHRLNQAFDRITAIIFQYEGTLDKFMGDCVMAFWNAPLPVTDHAFKAVRAATEIQALAAEFAGLSFGVGINTGEAVVGNIGSATRQEYTAIGDTVNVASRLESTAPAGTIQISEEVYRLVQGRVAAEDQGPLTVKNRAQPVHVYRVVLPAAQAGMAAAASEAAAAKMED